MKQITQIGILIAILSIFYACATPEKTSEEPPQTTEDPTTTALNKTEPAGTYGEMTLVETIELSQILAQPEAFEGKSVKVEGTISEICPKKGCWIDITNAESEKIRVKVNDGDIVFPLSSRGHQAIVEGVVERIELSKEQAVNWKAHEAEEKGEEFDPESVQGPMTIWRIKGAGAEIKS